MFFEKLKKDKYFVFVIILTIFHALLNITWIFLDNTPPGWDDSFHIIKTKEYAEYLKNNLFHFDIIEFLKISSYYPIFTYLIGVPFALISGSSYKFIQLTGTLFFAGTILVLYLYTKLNSKNSRIAFFTVFLFSFFITITETSRDHMLDLPLTMMVITTLYFMKKLTHTRKIVYIYLFFISFGLSQNTKWYAFIYLLIPFLFSFFKVIKDKFFIYKNIFHFALGFLIFILMTLPWYIINFSVISNYGGFALSGEKTDWQSVFSSETIFYYFKILTIFQIHFIGLLLFLFSIFIFIKRLDSFKWEVITLVIFSYSFFTFIVNKNIRYLIPLMPFLAIIMGYGLYWLIVNKKTWVNFIGSFIIFYYIISYFILFFGFPIYPKYKYAIKFPLIGWIDVFYLADYPVRYIYNKQKWPQSIIIEDIASLSPHAKVLVNIDRLDFNSNNLTLFAQFSNHSFLKFSCPYLLMKDIVSKEKMFEFVSRFDFVLIPQNKVIGEDVNFISYEPLKRFQNFFLFEKPSSFRLIRKYFLPSSYFLINNQDTILLFQRI